MNNQEQLDIGETSDGYHTFNELYEHRHALVLALMKLMPEKSWMAINHFDGTFFKGHFIVGVELPTGQITYHLPQRLWALAAVTGARVRIFGDKWDGHTSEQAVERLKKFADNKEPKT